MCPLLAAAALLAGPPAESPAGPPAVFHLTEDEGVWTLRTPAGAPFLMRGVNHFGDGTDMPWNRADRYGAPADWRAALPGRLKDWGFNYVPPSTGPTAIDPAKPARPSAGRTSGRRSTSPRWTCRSRS